MKGKTVTCEYVVEHPKICERRAWVKELCPISCDICKDNEIEPKEVEESTTDEPVFIGTVENDMFITSPSQPLQAKVKMFGPSSIKPYVSCDELRTDVKNFASLIVNEAITDNARLDPIHLMYRSREYDMVDSPEGMSSSEGEDSYETNVQVEGVDEADVVKSTNETVYVAYGDKLIAFQAVTLKKLSVTIMPPIQKNERRLTSVFFPHRRQVSIRGLLLFNSRLAVIVSQDHWYYPYRYSAQNHTILQNYGSVSIRLYDVSDLPDDGESELKLIGTKDLKGSYLDARLINGTAHIITSAQVDTYYHLTRHFSRYSNDKFENMTEAEYTVFATSLASSVIPSFVENLLSEVDNGKQCSDIMQLTLFQSYDGVQPQKVQVMPRYSIMNGLAQVNTFNMEDSIGDAFQTFSTSLLLPSNYNTEVYASKNNLVLATRGYEVSPNGTGSTEKTFFQVLSLTNNGTESTAIGEVQGYLLNQYAMDIWDGHLRIATTTSAKWGCVINENITSTDMQLFFIRQCNRTIIVDSDNYIHILRIPINSSETTLEKVGYLNNLGKFGERIEAVRFMTDKAFLVTFFRTDPFYTIDLSKHDNPREVGSLEITGFSNYLHPYDYEGNILIGVGQDADKDGRATGLQISLFNATDLSNIALLNRYSVENEPNVWSSSAAQYEPKSFRFLPQSKIILPTSIRNYDDSSKNFDGFLIFDLSSSRYEIYLSFNISHVMEPRQLVSFCWYNAYLPSRSIVHSGVVTTIKGHSILAHDLNTKEMVSPVLNLDENNTVCGNGGYWVD